MVVKCLLNTLETQRYVQYEYKDICPSSIHHTSLQEPYNETSELLRKNIFQQTVLVQTDYNHHHSEQYSVVCLNVRVRPDDGCFIGRNMPPF
jgi:hypothetical protein